MNKHTTFKSKTQKREMARRRRQYPNGLSAPPRRAKVPPQRDHRSSWVS